MLTYNTESTAFSEYPNFREICEKSQIRIIPELSGWHVVRAMISGAASASHMPH